MTAENQEEQASGGLPALAGYDYQIDVSVWLALSLVLDKKLTDELILEPRGQDDVEANLDDVDLPRTATRASVNKYQLVVQAKLRNGDAWSVPEIEALLKHGKRRISAAKRLAD